RGGAVGGLCEPWLSEAARPPHAPGRYRSPHRCRLWPFNCALPGLVLAVKSGAGLAALVAFQGENEPDLVCVIDNIDLTTPYYLLMHRDMQQTPKVRAFADFVGSEIKSFRAMVSKEVDAPR